MSSENLEYVYNKVNEDFPEYAKTFGTLEEFQTKMLDEENKEALRKLLLTKHNEDIIGDSASFSDKVFMTSSEIPKNEAEVSNSFVEKPAEKILTDEIINIESETSILDQETKEQNQFNDTKSGFADSTDYGIAQINDKTWNKTSMDMFDKPVKDLDVDENIGLMSTIAYDKKLNPQGWEAWTAYENDNYNEALKELQDNGASSFKEKYNVSEELLRKVQDKFGKDWQIAASIIQAESGWNPNATNKNIKDEDSTTEKKGFDISIPDFKPETAIAESTFPTERITDLTVGENLLAGTFFGAQEAALSVTSGMISMGLSGLVGIDWALQKNLGYVPTDRDVTYKGADGQIHTVSKEKLNELMSGIQEKFTYQPKTIQGQWGVQIVSWPFEKLAEVGTWAADWIYEETGSPIAAAGTQTFIEGLPFLIAPIKSTISRFKTTRPKAGIELFDFTKYEKKGMAKINLETMIEDIIVDNMSTKDFIKKHKINPNNKKTIETLSEKLKQEYDVWLKEHSKEAPYEVVDESVKTKGEKPGAEVTKEPLDPNKIGEISIETVDNNTHYVKVKDKKGGIIDSEVYPTIGDAKYACSLLTVNRTIALAASRIDPSNPSVELVKSFQKVAGLEVDGIFGPETTKMWQSSLGIKPSEKPVEETPVARYEQKYKFDKTENDFVADKLELYADVIERGKSTKEQVESMGKDDYKEMLEEKAEYDKNPLAFMEKDLKLAEVELKALKERDAEYLKEHEEIYEATKFTTTEEKIVNRIEYLENRIMETKETIEGTPVVEETGVEKSKREYTPNIEMLENQLNLLKEGNFDDTGVKFIWEGKEGEAKTQAIEARIAYLEKKIPELKGEKPPVVEETPVVEGAPVIPGSGEPPAPPGGGKPPSPPKEEPFDTHPYIDEALVKDTGHRVFLNKRRKLKLEVIKTEKEVTEWNKTVPNEIDRYDIGAMVEGIPNILKKGDTIEAVKERMTPEKTKVLEKYKVAIEKSRTELNDYLEEFAGVEGEYIAFLESYLPHFYRLEGTDRIKGNYSSAIDKIKDSPNVKKRKLPTYQDAIDAGLIPLSQDPGVLLRKYNELNWRNATNKMFLHELSQMKGEDGVNLVFPSNAKAPANYVPFDHPLTRRVFSMPDKNGKMMPTGHGILVHPELEPVVKMLIQHQNDYSPGAWQKLKRAYTVSNNTAKAMALSFSLFHHFALTESSQAVFMGRNPIRGIFMFGVKNPLTGERQFMPHREGLKLIKDEAIFEDAIMSGLEINHPNLDDHTGLFKNMRDRMKGNVKNRAWRKSIDGLTYLPIKYQELLWGHYHSGLKMMAWHENTNAFLKEFPELSPVEAKELSASLINNAFGGQEWESKLILGNPEIKNALSATLLAPDWTYSNLMMGYEPASDITSKITGKSLPGSDPRWRGDKYRGPKSKFHMKYWRNMAATIFGTSTLASLAIYEAYGDEEKGDVKYPWQYEKGHRIGQIDITPMKRHYAESTGVEWTTERRTYIKLGKQATELMGYFDGPTGWKDTFRKKSSPLATFGYEFITGYTTTDWDSDIYKTDGVSIVINSAVRAAESFAPFSIQGNNFAYTLPLIKGTSSYEGNKMMTEVLMSYIDPGILQRSINKYGSDNLEFAIGKRFEKFEPNLEELFPEVIEALERNGFNSEKVLTEAVSGLAAKLNNEYLRVALDEDGNWKNPDEYSEKDRFLIDYTAYKLAKLHKGADNLFASLINKSSGGKIETRDSENFDKMRKVLRDAYDKMPDMSDGVLDEWKIKAFENDWFTKYQEDILNLNRLTLTGEGKERIGLETK